jgi:UDP-N-acetylmuramoylalanine-D-glutamate ligase
MAGRNADKPRALVWGLAIAGQATARALVSRGYRVIAADDRPTPEGIACAAELGIDLFEAPPEPKAAQLVERVDIVVPSPGVAYRTRPCVRMGSNEPGRPTPDARYHRYRWQNHHHHARDGNG